MARVPRGDGFLVAAVAFVVYVVCGREAWHGIDMLALLNEDHRSGMSHPYYWFFPSLLRAMRVVVAPFGGGIYHGGLLLSALGTAIGVAGVHAAGRQLALSRSGAAFAALVFATMPGIVYFAVVVEVHGHLLACCGVVWLLMARWATAPRPQRAVAVGLALGVAGLAHPLSALAGAAMLPFACLASPPPALRPRLVGFLVAFGCLLLFLVLFRVVLPMVGLTDDLSAADSPVADALSRLFRVAHGAGRPAPGVSIVREWLVPFFPASAVVIALLWRRSARAVALATLAALAPFVLVSWLLFWVDERGAYVTMAAGPLALTFAVHLRALWLRTACLALAIATAIWLCRGLPVTPEAAATAAAVHAAVGDRPMAWLVGDGAGPDGQVWLTRHPSCHVVVLADLLGASLPQVEQALVRIGEQVDGHARAGIRTIVTNTTLDALATFAAAHDVSRAMHGWLLARRGAVLGEAGGVTVYAVRGR